MRKKLLPVWVFAKIEILRSFRDKMALFFIFLFPLIFLFIFGGIFGKQSDISFRVALLNESSSQFSKDFSENLKNNKILKVDQEATNNTLATEKMQRGQIDAIISLPQGFGEITNNKYPEGQAVITYSQNNSQAADALSSVLQGIFNEINAGLVKSETPFTVNLEQSNTKSLSSFDYIFSGLLGFAVIGLGIFGPMSVFPQLKKQGVLRRLHTTPLKVWQYFLANVIAQAVVGILSLALMFVVALTVFDLKIAGNIFDLVVFLVLSIVTVFGIGLAIGGWARDERQASPLGNIIAFPLMFLTGAFFPRFLMPEWLQKISEFLPLTPVIDGARLIANEGKSLIDIGPQVGLLAIWLVVIYIIAFRVFRWE